MPIQFGVWSERIEDAVRVSGQTMADGKGGGSAGLDGDHRTCRDPHRCTPAQAKIVAIDRRRSAEACAHAHHRALTTVLNIEDDGFGHPMQGQVPSHLVVLTANMLDVRARKSDSRI